MSFDLDVIPDEMEEFGEDKELDQLQEEEDAGY